MHSRTRSAAGVALLGVALSCDVLAAQPTTPRPAHERLTFMEGTWTHDGPIISDAHPQGRVAGPFEETCAWLPGGRRHMVCRAREETANGAVERMAVFSYRGADSTYVLHVFFAGGQTFTYEGRPEGEGWLFDLQPTAPFAARKQRLRQRITPVEGGGLRFIEEVSENGGPWRVGEDFRYRRVPGGGGGP